MIKMSSLLLFNHFFQNLILKVIWRLYEGYMKVIWLFYMKKEMMRLFFCLSSSLVIILFYDDAQPHLARMTLHKLTDLGLETLPHTPYFPDLFLIDYYEHFFYAKKKFVPMK